MMEAAFRENMVMRTGLPGCIRLGYAVREAGIGRLGWVVLLLGVVLNPFVLRGAPPGTGWPDEPNELSWEHAATCLACFEDFARWTAGRDSGWPQVLAAMPEPVSALPASFPTVLIPAEAFAGAKAPWSLEAPTKLVTRKGGMGRLLRAPPGHNAGATRTGISIPATGWYRLWVRAKHVRGYHASFRARLLPAEALHTTMPWQTSMQGDFLNHRFDFAEHGRRQPVLSHRDDAGGFFWESCPMVFLTAGRMTLEVAGCIHGGPFTFRRIDGFVLTADPLFRPTKDNMQGRFGEGVVVGAYPPSASTKRRWRLWQLRPGGRPLADSPPVLVRCWQRWRRDLVGRLARGECADLHQRRLARAVYFDPDWNLIGTPAQVRDKVRRLRRMDRKPTSWFRTIEAENMREQKPGWTVQQDAGSSGGARLTAPYADLVAERIATVRIPEAGKAVLWVRHSRIKGYTNRFHVRFEAAGAKVGSRCEFGEEPCESGGYRLRWTAHDVVLGKGPLTVVLGTSRGKSPYAYRHVDRIVLTNDRDWVPRGTGEVPVAPEDIRAWSQIGGKEGRELVVWRQGNPWLGFSMASARAGAGDTCFPRSMVFDLLPGEVASGLIHCTNSTRRAQSLTPRITGPGAAMFRWRLVAHVLSKAYGWQAMPLLDRREVTVPPLCTASIWITCDSRVLSTARRAVLRLGETEIVLRPHSGEFRGACPPPPLVGGWCAPYATPASWRLFADIGINVIHGKMLPKEEMKTLGIRLFNVTLGTPPNADRVARVVAATRAMGLDYGDWSWEIFDEPGDKSSARWAAAAQQVKSFDRAVRIWCNPGDAAVCKTAALRQMAPYVDVFCPYINHFSTRLGKEHRDLVLRTGSVKLFYTTPCFAEKAPHAPLDLLRMAESALEYKRDGWDMFSLNNSYEYCNTPWDDVEAYNPAQAVSIYPGAWKRAISTRNLEAVREAIQRWRRARAGGGRWPDAGKTKTRD